MKNPYSLEGKTILITGASSGIGRAAAVECSRMGATLILNGRNVDRLQETLAMLEGKKHKAICADLSSNEGVSIIVDELPKLDGAVLNAGMSKMASVQFYTEGDLENLFHVNTFAPMLLMKQMVRKKKLRNPSSVVFTASISGYNNVAPGVGIYGASKAALSSYMKYAAIELAYRGIRCNAVHPGRIETPLIVKNNLSEDEVRKDIDTYPLKRYGRPEEVAWAIIYLLSDASAWVTGTNLVIDGGRSLL